MTVTEKQRPPHYEPPAHWWNPDREQEVRRVSKRLFIGAQWVIVILVLGGSVIGFLINLLFSHPRF